MPIISRNNGMEFPNSRAARPAYPVGSAMATLSAGPFIIFHS